MKVKLAILILMFLSFQTNVFADIKAWRAKNIEARDLFMQGNEVAALQKAEEALNYAKMYLKNDYGTQAKSYNNIGVLFFTQRNFDEAKGYFNDAMDLIESNLGERHPQLADTLVNRARVYFIEENYGATLTDLESALDIREAQFGEEHEQVIMILTMIAQVYQGMGLQEDAIKVQQRMGQIVSRMKQVPV